MIAYSYYSLINMKGSHRVRKTRGHIHQNIYIYPFDFVHIHLWHVPLRAAWGVCVVAKQKHLEEDTLSGNGPRSVFYYLFVTALSMLRTRMLRWLLCAPFRVITHIGCYQVDANIPTHALWSAYALRERGLNGCS